MEKITIFSDDLKEQALKNKKMAFWIWFSVLMVVVAVFGICLGINIYQVNVYRDRSMQGTFMAICLTLSCLFTIGSVFFFSIKYKLLRNYVKLFRNIDKGIKDVAIVKFIEREYDLHSKDGLEFYRLIFNAKPIKREDIDTRAILLEHTIDLEEFNPGDKLKVVTHANILVSYQVMERAEVKHEE